jgi:hypothetical protein
MEDKVSLSELRAYAEKRIAAQRYPNDYHFFQPKGCSTCGVVPLSLVIEHHTGARKGDFKGIIYARCSVCEREQRIFSFTGDHRKPERTEAPQCQCGSQTFIVAELERMEGDEGLMGFFDEGVVVGQCSECDRKRAFVFTD